MIKLSTTRLLPTTWPWIVLGVICSLGLIRASGTGADETSSTSKWTPPSGYSAQRYEALWKRSPFTLSSISDDAGTKASNFALAGYLKIGDSEFVTVIDKQSRVTSFVSREPNAQGLKLLSVSTNVDPLKVTAQICKADITEMVGYDPAILSAPVKTGPPAQVATVIAGPKSTLPAIVEQPEQPAPPEHAPHAERRILRPTPILPPSKQ
jgi:hypothetical protein